MTHPGLTEHGEQHAVFLRVAILQKKHPELRWLHAIPNERFSATQRMYFSQEGVKPGVADLCLPHARGGYFGLYIEMKKPGGRAEPEQKEFISFVQENGYYAKICYGQDEAMEFIEEYFNMPPTAFPALEDHYDTP